MLWLDNVVRAKGAQRLPVVLTRAEVRAVIQRLQGTPSDGAPHVRGQAPPSRVCRATCQDVPFASNQIVVREGKGNKDRVTVLPVYGRIARLTWEPLFDMDAAFEPMIPGMKAKK